MTPLGQHAGHDLNPRRLLFLRESGTPSMNHTVRAIVWLLSAGICLEARSAGIRVDYEMCTELAADELKSCLAPKMDRGTGVCSAAARQKQRQCVEQVRAWLSNQARLASDKAAEQLRQEVALAPQASARRFRDAPHAPILVSIEPGRFRMGYDGDSTTSPAHEVHIGYPFAISSGEITEAEWALCADAGACSKVPLVDDFGRPLSQARQNRAIAAVSWHEAQNYTAWLTSTTGKTYRLPTEAEWEYAARAGTSSRFWWGEGIGDANANCMNVMRPGRDAFDVVGPAETKRYPANPWGLFDTAGNVEEWVLDCPRQTEYQGYVDPPTDGSANQRCTDDQRMTRGGSAWLPGECTSAYRRAYPAVTHSTVVGFRVVREGKR